MSFDFKSLLESVAPTMATVLAGPEAGLAVKALSDHFLGKPDGSRDEIAVAMESATPAQLLALKQADIEFKEHMADLGIQTQAQDNANTASARALGIAKGIKPQVILSAFFVLGYFGILAAIFTGFARIPTEVHDLVVTLIGTLGAGVVQILNYWFGSTHSSQAMGDTISQIATSD